METIIFSLLFNCFYRANSYFCKIYKVLESMKHIKFLSFVLGVFFLCSCNGGSTKADSTIMSRDFMDDIWERFDFVTNDIQIEKETTYDLSMNISFTEAYRYDDFSMVFSVFDTYGNPYRCKAYKFSLKDNDGSWKSELIDGCYTFELPINNALMLTDPGKYTFQIEYRMPITPLEGVRSLKLYNNN